MKTKTPTDEQQQIIDYESNLAVIANPGSGKTYTLSIKIKNILSNLPNYKGVIAISFTNKASQELKQRSLDGGINAKNSFFGTIDSFFYSELILPFMPRFFGEMPKDGLNTIKIDEIREEDPSSFEILNNLLNGAYKLNDSCFNVIQTYYRKGLFFIDLFGHVGLYIYENSLTAQNYLKARYSHVIIDEFQDSGLQQYQLFYYLVKQNLIGIAVGDIDQSIFRWARKNPQYLIDLQNNKDFKSYTITRNHRCHKNIVNYSKKLLIPSLTVEMPEKSRVLHRCITGTQIEIAKYIDEFIPKIKEKVNTEENNKIAILVKSYVSGNIINDNLTTPHKYINNTILDNSTEIWARIFIDTLFYTFDKNALITEFLENWIIYDLNKQARNLLVQNLQFLKSTELNELKKHLQIFIDIANILSPKQYSSNSIKLMEQVLNNNEYLNSYMPVRSDEVQIMTLHKSKGLEFDIVFHLDLYSYIIPSGNAQSDETEWNEYLNLHYVGVTRAKKVCYLLTSTQRYNYQNRVLNASESEFLRLNDLIHYRQNYN